MNQPTIETIIEDAGMDIAIADELANKGLLPKANLILIFSIAKSALALAMAAARIARSIERIQNKAETGFNIRN